MRGHEPLPSSVNRDTPSRDSAGLLLRRLRSGRCRIRRSRRLALRQRSARHRPDHIWADSSSPAAPARPAPALSPNSWSTNPAWVSRNCVPLPLGMSSTVTIVQPFAVQGTGQAAEGGRGRQFAGNTPPAVRSSRLSGSISLTSPRRQCITTTGARAPCTIDRSHQTSPRDSVPPDG